MSNANAFSFTKGYSFIFNDEEKEIRAWFSSLTGLEKVYVNGEVIYSQRNLSKNSSSKFKIGANEYSTNMAAISLLKGPFVCTLTKNGKAFKRQRLVFHKSKSTSDSVNSIAAYALIGLVFAVVQDYFQLPEASFYVFAVIVFFAVLLYQARIKKGFGAVIEDEEIA